MIAAIAAITVAVAGSVAPVFESAFAQETTTNTGQTCDGASRCNQGQSNINGDNEADDITFNTG